MSGEIVHKEHSGDFTLEIYLDTYDLGDPREDYDHFGYMATWHRRYTFGDTKSGHDTAHISSPRDWLAELACKEIDVKVDPSVIPWKHIERILDKHFIILPISLLDHSGLRMWVGSGSHWSDSGGWDSGQVGWIYCSVKEALNNWSAKSLDDLIYYEHDNTTKTVRDRAKDLLRCEVEEYNYYISNECYGWQIRDNGVDDIVDSCGMYLGPYEKSGCLSDGKNSLDHYSSTTPKQLDLPLVYQG